MRKLFFVFAFAFVLVSCDNYGKKVKINDTLDVYLKGDNVNENEARKLGHYITELSGNAKNKKSFQLSRDGEKFIVKMVVDKDKLKADTSLDESFVALKTLLEANVFNNRPVKFTVTDDHFKDLKSY